MPSRKQKLTPLGLLGQRIALAGLALYVVFAPHSVAGGVIAVAIAGLGWLVRTVASGWPGLRRSRFDLIVLLSLLWTLISSILSAEPRISLLKVRSSWCVFIFYLARAVITRRSALALVCLLILSGSAGALYSLYDLVRGRGVVIESLDVNSPLHQIGVQPGDTIWRVGALRIYSKSELDHALATVKPDVAISVSIFSQGEHAVREGLTISAAEQKRISPSGISGGSRNHRFRASGWTRHYETFAELLQMIAQLALGLALAHFKNHGTNSRFKVAAVAVLLLVLGVSLTAMRTVIVAFVVGASVIALRALRGSRKVVFTFALFFVLAFAAVVVWQTRARHALFFADPSSSLRYQVAKVGLSRIVLHPVFGHGMDAMKNHWQEWGFPGEDMLHLHSTPLQLAFDRGVPMLILWLWMMAAFWIYIARSEEQTRDGGDTNSYGITLGVLGALTGFLFSSLVNYNYGDAEAAMLFWWLMGVAMVIQDRQNNLFGAHDKSLVASDPNAK